MYRYTSEGWTRRQTGPNFACGPSQGVDELKLIQKKWVEEKHQNVHMSMPYMKFESEIGRLRGENMIAEYESDARCEHNRSQYMSSAERRSKKRSRVKEKMRYEFMRHEI